MLFVTLFALIVFCVITYVLSLKAKKYNLEGYTPSKRFLAFFILAAITVILFIIITNPVMSELSNLSTIGEKIIYLSENEHNTATFLANNSQFAMFSLMLIEFIYIFYAIMMYIKACGTKIGYRYDLSPMYLFKKLHFVTLAVTILFMITVCLPTFSIIQNNNIEDEIIKYEVQNAEIENELNRITLNVKHADDLIPVASYGSLNTKVMPKLNLYKNNAEIIEDLNSAKSCIKSLEYFLYFRK